jgi:hypothetical protein
MTDEYAMGADEGEELDEGIGADALPEPGFGKLASASRKPYNCLLMAGPTKPSHGCCSVLLPNG